jgi:hypothetical protein
LAEGGTPQAKGVYAANCHLKIWPRLPGLVHFAPAGGRQARVDLTRVKSTKEAVIL